jgi:hypothetical protein
MPKTFAGKPSELPYGIHFANGGSGSLTFTGTNRLEGPFDVVSATSPAFTDLSGTAIRLAGQNFNLTGSVISKWKTGLLVRETTDEAIVRQNRFFGNQTAIDLSPQAPNTIDNMNLNLGCNRFDHRYIIQQPGQEIPFELTGNATGLRIGPGVSLFDNRIGGNGQTGTGFEFPNSNYWPRIGTGLDPDPVTNFTSILLENGGLLNYHRYGNEHLGKVVPEFDANTTLGVRERNLQNTFSVKPNDIQTHCTANYTTANCNFSSVGNCITSISENLSNYDASCTGGINWRLACTEGGAFDFVSFPITRPAPTDTSYQALVKVQETQFGEDPYLGQSIPNPGSGKINIPIFIPTKAKGGRLLVIEPGTGRKVHERNLGMGVHFIGLDVGHWNAGVYFYQLELEGGQAVKTQKMVVVH